MKTIEEIEEEMKYGDVYTSEEFSKALKSGCFSKYDGFGYFHDGENITKVSVWCRHFKKYPYVVWYNK